MKRFMLVFRNEFASCFRRPLFWVLLVIVLLTSWGLSTGRLRIASGNATVGGTQAWITSEFALAQMLTLVAAIFYSFFLVVAAGMSVIHDRELKVGEVLHATPLRAGEYVWGKFLAVLAGFLVILAAHLLFTMLFFQWFPNPNAEDIRGPFSLLNYLRPALIFSIPTLIFFAGVSFALGERTNRPILVFMFPAAAILLCGFFLWNWSPSWLDPRWNQFLMLIDPAGFRWLNETWLTVDQGVEFYNTSRIQFDWVFWANRAAIILIGLTAVLWSQGRFSDTLRNPGKARRFRKQSALAAPPSAGLEEAAGHPSLAALQMRTSLPGFLGGAWKVARTEMTELRSQPGLYLFVPIILLQTLGSSLTSIGAFNTPLLLTSGTMAVNSMNALTLMVCLLLLFYTVESLQRERSTGLDSIFYATPVKSASILFGKALANSLVGAVVVTAMLAACWLAQRIQNMFYGVQVPFELHPFFLSWGLLLIPTFLVWTSFVTLIQSVARNRYFTYAAGLAALIATGYYQFIGDMNWAFNWNLWGAVTWSDMGIFELNRSPLILNRVMILGLTVLFTAASVRFLNRLDPDASRTIQRLNPLNQDLQRGGGAMGGQARPGSGRFPPSRAPLQRRRDFRMPGRGAQVLLRMVLSLPLGRAQAERIPQSGRLCPGIRHQHHFFGRDRLFDSQRSQDQHRLPGHRSRVGSPVVGKPLDARTGAGQQHLVRRHVPLFRLMEQVKGLRERIEFSKRIEERYGNGRRVDSERPLVQIDGSRPGDTTVTYERLAIGGLPGRAPDGDPGRGGVRSSELRVR
ncbi:MAG: ABC transporter permease subunit, partial [Acidobacteriota bacterium]